MTSLDFILILNLVISDFSRVFISHILIRSVVFSEVHVVILTSVVGLFSLVIFSVVVSLCFVGSDTRVSRGQQRDREHQWTAV